MASLLSVSITPALPDSSRNPDREAFPEDSVYYLDASGYPLKVDEFYLDGGMKYADDNSSSCTVEFRITTDDGLASVTMDEAAYPVENGVFFLPGVSFTAIGEDSAAYLEGKANEAVTATGADGVASIAFDVAMNGRSIAAEDGTVTLSVNENGTHIVGVLGGGTVAFEAYLTESAREWAYAQYGDSDFEGDRGIE